MLSGRLVIVMLSAGMLTYFIQHASSSSLLAIKTLKPVQNGQNFEDIIKGILLNEKFWFANKI